MTSQQVYFGSHWNYIWTTSNCDKNYRCQ